jgi:hypothetical protein
MILPDTGSLLQYRLPPASTLLVDKPIDGFANELALFLAGGLGHLGQFVTLTLGQIYLGSYHAAPLIMYTSVLYIIENLFQEACWIASFDTQRTGRW